MEAELEEFSGRLEVGRGGAWAVVHHHAVAPVVEPAHVLDAIVHGDEAADDVAQPAGDGRTRMPHRAGTEGHVTLLHVDHLVDVLEVGAPSAVVAGLGEGDGEGEERRVDVDVRARVRRVILENGDGVGAQLAAVADERGEERGHVREEHLLASAAEPRVHSRHQLNLGADRHLGPVSVLHTRPGGLCGVAPASDALLLGELDDPVHLLGGEERRAAHVDLCVRRLECVGVVDRRHAHRVEVVLEGCHLLHRAAELILAHVAVVLVVLRDTLLHRRERIRVVRQRAWPVQVRRQALGRLLKAFCSSH
mmetsp:Transcript_23886/g.57049  ORF Transcript_23886/g.57049 Transcript_23886/m.57049 type:complete len:307 (+) Transcript_23886:1133-2053(+)